MGKKPVLGMMSALCVGLVLTGCRNASTQSDGSVTKANGPVYRTPGAFSANSGATMNAGAPVPGYNPNPPPASQNAAWPGAATSMPTTPGATLNTGSVKPVDTLTTSHSPPSAQTDRTTAPPSSPYSDVSPAGVSVQPPAGVVHDVTAPSRLLPAPPSVVGTGATMLPDQAAPPPAPIGPPPAPMGPMLDPSPAPVAPAAPVPLPPIEPTPPPTLAPAAPTPPPPSPAMPLNIPDPAAPPVPGPPGPPPG